jgi:stage II sporulation protein P
MQAARKLGIVGLIAIGLYMLSISGAGGLIGNLVAAQLGESRMKNVSVAEDTETVTPVVATVKASPKPVAQATAMPVMEPTESEEPIASNEISGQSEQILETNIQGGLSIKNETSYWVDATQIVADGPDISLTAGEPQILIIHTHSSEAYTQAGLDRYEASDTNRTENTEFNIVRIGDELTELLQQAGLNVIHDRGIYDYPSYTGSYTRSGQAVEQYLEAYPSISIVIDMHRDALGTDDVVYKTMAEEDGVCASQIMLLVGSDESGLEHPNWRQNLSLALYLQNAVNLKHPTLMRPVSLVRQRYNQHLSTGSMILEVGSSGNTLQEALAAIRLFADAAAPALAELVK